MQFYHADGSWAVVEWRVELPGVDAEHL